MKRILYLGLVFYGGFCSMGLEMTAARILAPYFGTSNYIWTNVIGVILLALSLGYFLGGRLADRRPHPKVLAACVLAAGLCGMPIPFVMRPLAEALLPTSLTLDDAFLLVFKGSLLGAILFAPSIVLVGMVSPFVIRILAAQSGRVGDATGSVFAVSTIGSLLGIFAATFLLVPSLGSRMTVLLFCGLLVAVALAMLAWPSLLAAAGLLAFAPMLLASGAAFKTHEGSLGEWESGYQYIRVREEGDTRYLTLNEGLDSFHSLLVKDEYLTRGAYYDWYNAFPFLFPEGGSFDVAILGGGGGTGARQLTHFFGGRFDLHVDSVEIDPMVTEIGRRFFDYPTQGVRVFDLDARVFVNLTTKKYDLIIIDAYANQVYIPFHVATREFFQEVRRLLRDRGVVAMNVGAFEPQTPLVEAIVATLRSVFPASFAMALPQSRNLLLYGLVGIDSVDVMLEAARGSELESIAAGVALGSRSVDELWPGAASMRPLTDSRAPVEWLTDRMLLRRNRETLR